MNQHHVSVRPSVPRLARGIIFSIFTSLSWVSAAAAQAAVPVQAESVPPAEQPTVRAEQSASAGSEPVAPGVSANLSSDTNPEAKATAQGYQLGVHAELDVGALIFLRQGVALAGGAVWGPFRAGMSYATFLSNKSFGGTPDGFSMRANYIVGFNVSYFIGQSTDDGLYVQGMFHIKQQGVTNTETGDHRDLNSLALGLELGYVWKVYNGLYVAPRLGALYYVKSPQGKDNAPVRIGNRDYDNGRHKVFDTYLIPTLSVGYSW